MRVVVERVLAIAGGVLAVAVSVHAADGVDARWWAPNDAREFPASLSYPDAHGVVTTLNVSAPTQTAGHPFFTSIGANGRACVTCHQPADGMSLSVDSVRARWQDTAGKDPLFAAIDGSNCPSLPQEQESSHSLLLTRGLIRIARPWPPRTPEGKPIDPEFTIEVVRDPTQCNRDPIYGLAGTERSVSVYRRPRAATNIKFLTAVGFPFEPKQGMPLPTDRETGRLVSGNILADNRAPTIPAQIRDAMHAHLGVAAPSPAAVTSIEAFMQQLYTAQSVHITAGTLTDGGTQGGPEILRDARDGDLQYGGSPIWKEFLAWLQPAARGNGSAEQQAFRESVARGADLFAKRTFLIDESAGITNMGFGSPVRNSCAFCHNMQRTGMDVAPGQVDLGTTNSPHADSAPDMPLFKLTCKDTARPHPHLGRVVYTQDPGFALTTGKCVDIGKITIQSMRGLAARPPYFSNGSAKTLRDIIDFYERRYRIGLTEQEKQDLTNLLSVL
jgi:hypothetical protein